MNGTEPKPLSFSIIVASRHRSDWLTMCLTALSQQDYSPFEIIVVTDNISAAGLDGSRFKVIRFDEANLSKARNLGVAAAGGEICAFVDDDAMAEPYWLKHLNAAFAETSADAVCGFVRGRNGISFQSKGHVVDAEAETHTFSCDETKCTMPQISGETAIKLIGTNMAIRRDVLAELGGFDEGFRFFLEDSDYSMRLIRAGKRTAIQPLAQVHHSFASSGRRTALRAPLDLSDVGRSTAIYLRKHLGDAGIIHWQRLEGRERRRLVEHMVAGNCEPRDVERRISGLRAGWQEGMEAEFGSRASIPSKAEFRLFPRQTGPHQVFAAPWLRRRANLVEQAGNVARSGGRASVFSFSLTPVRHHVRYARPGFWLQTGGVFGRSDREGRRIRWCSFAHRLKREISRVAKIRGIGDT